MLAGRYTITEIKDWSWRYSTETIGPKDAGTGVVTFSFDEKVTEEYWLNGYSDIEKNIYKGGS